MKPVYIFIGIPGSGKDTQAKLLAKELDLPHVDAGSTFREIIEKKLKYWDYIQDTFTNSQPIPSDMFFKIMSEKFTSDACNKGFVLSQNTKSVEEASDLQNLLQELGFTVKKVFYLSLSREEGIDRAVKRLNGKFTVKEPNMETLVRRIDTYVEIIPSIVNYYAEIGLLCEIDGRPGIDRIFESIKSNL